jgi:hypothetical protein
MKYQRTTHRLIPGCTVALAGFLFGTTLGAQSILLQESFESDGEDSRYAVLNGSDDGGSDYFARREVGSANTYGLSGGDLDGNWFWGIQDIDGEGQALEDLASDEARLTFNEISIDGYANLTLTIAFAQAANEVEFDNAVMLEYRVDGGEWITVGGFRGIHTNSAARYFEGDASTYPEPGAERLNRNFRDFSWNIFASGQTLQLRIYANANGSNEGYYFDNIRLTADAGLPSLGVSTSAETVSETAGAGGFQLDFALTEAAAAGGLEVSIRTSDTDSSELDLPDSFVIPEGTSAFSLPVDVIDDGQFDGDELVFMYISAPGYARELRTVTVTNTHSKPDLLMTEVYASPTDDDITTDSNGDGIANDSHDEYVEIVNLDTVAVDISGWIITDDLGPRHFVPENTVLQPNQAYVVFGGGDPTGLFGGAVVHTASTGNIAPSDRDTMTLLSGTGIVTSLTFDADIGDLDYSVVYASETDPSSGVVSLFETTGEAGPKFTPGLRKDGSPWTEFENRVILEGIADTLAETDAPVMATARLESAGEAVITIRETGENRGQVQILPAVADGLVAYWDFDDNLAATMGGSSFDLMAPAGADVSGSGRFGGAVEFDRGREQYLFTDGQVYTEGESLTYAAWYWLDPAIEGSDRYFIMETPNGDHPISLGLREDDGADVAQVYTYDAESDDKPNFTLDNGTSLGGEAGQWNHIAVTYDVQTGAMTAYLNGEVAGSLVNAGRLASSPGLVIGGHRDLTGRNFDGLIDEVAVWSRALSADEIAMLQTASVLPEGHESSTGLEITVTPAGTPFILMPINDGVLDGDREVRVFADGVGVFPDAKRIEVPDSQADIYEVVINEALSSVVGTAGDPNNNGIVEEPLDDLFVELVNASDDWVNLGDWSVDAYADNNLSGAEQIHLFPNPTWVPPMGAVVLFGGGDADAMAASGFYGNAIIQIANRGGNGVNLHDYEGNEIMIRTPYGHIEDYIFFDSDISDQSQSVTRNPDLEPVPIEDTSWEEIGTLHFDVSTAFELYSPGRDLAGQPFPGSGSMPPEVPTFFREASIYMADGAVLDPSMGWLSTEDWPFVYVYELGRWFYALAGSPIFMWDFTDGDWVYIFHPYYPWYYSYGENAWLRF